MIKQASKKLNLKELEERIQRYWEENKIYEKQKEALKNKPKYYFLDGPPYASGAIHLGTAWNKIIKDSILRYLAMRGYNVRRQAGWDCHGLPIEVKVEQKLGIKNKKEIEELGIEKFVQECKSWAIRHVEIMTSQFKRLGVWMDWRNPYMTLKDDYIEAAWWTIKRAYEKNLLEKSLRVVTWCPRCETALAEAEIEYKEREDPSIYVKFPVLGRENEFIVIWTTTPWTLIGNLAVAVHPNFEYVRAKTKEGILILAKELVHILKDKFNLEYEIIEVIKGKELEGLRYRNPLSDYINVKPCKNSYKVILADFVTLGEGTGCVHCAPGHGPEDFEVCLKYNIKPICPVADDGSFTEEAGRYAKLVTKKDDKIIIKDLENLGFLLLAETLTHRYGHCWRCKTPIIYRATEQWFIKITEVKEDMLREIERVDWVPEWAGSARFKDWVENARDWTISRQRYWGIPLPIWVCEKCNKIKVIGSRKELGVDVKELHKPYVDGVVLKCDCGGEMHRVKDVLDVWFDSGVAPWASLGYPSNTQEFNFWYPADFITEGHDQTRGWFYSQLGCGIIAFDEVPYRRVLMHGFTLDEKGEKMSKSLGNVVTPEEVIEKYGAEVLRFYTLWANKPWDDLKFSWEEVRVINKLFNVYWNVYVFATTYMSIDNFSPSKFDTFQRVKFKIEDLWILSRLNSLIKKVTEAFEKLHLYNATRAIHEFILEDLSRWYITLIRPRTWIESDAPEKLAAYATLYEVLLKLCILLAPITPHLSEEIYLNLSKRKESVHLEEWVSYNEKAIDQELEEDMKIARKLVEATAAARERARVKRRWTLTRIIFHAKDENAKKAIERLENLVKAQANTLKIEILGPEEKFKEIKLVVKPVYPELGKEFREKSTKIAELLKTLTFEELEKRGFKVSVEGEEIELAKRHFTIEEALPENIVSMEFEHGVVYIDLTMDEKILSLGYAREVVRRIQQMRKELDLDIEAFIKTKVEVKDEKIVELLENQREYISRETRSKLLEISTQAKHEGYVKEWDINNKHFVISIKE